MRQLLFVTTMFALLCGFACPEKKTTADPLENTNWQLKLLTESGKPAQTIPADVMITANFKAGNLTGKGACNGYNATYSLTSARLALGMISSTKMYCPAYNLELSYFKALHGDLAWKVEGNKLTLQGAEATLVFEKP